MQLSRRKFIECTGYLGGSVSLFAWANIVGIRALAVAPDGKLYGATSGKRNHLFLLDPVHGYVLPL